MDPNAPWLAAGRTSTGWDRFMGVSGVTINGLVATDAGLLAVGASDTGAVAPAGRATAWRLDPAGAWTRDALPSRPGTVMETPAGGAAGGVAGAEVVVLAGSGGTADCAHPYGGTSWVHSAAGWQQAPALPDDCVRTYSGVAHGDAGFIESTCATGEVYTLWRSLDGLAWSEQPAAAAIGQEVILGAIAALPGRYVVVGRHIDGSPAAWQSTDGRTWSALPLSAAGTVNASVVIAGAGRVVIVGGLDTGTAGTWIVDGATGTVKSQAAAAGLAAGLVAAATGTGDAIVLAGTTNDRPMLWLSADGALWRSLSIEDGAARPLAVAIEPARITVLGAWTDANGVDRPIVWSRPWPLPAG